MSINRPAWLIIAGAALVCAVALAVPAWRHWNETPPPAPAALRLELPNVADLTSGAGPDHPFGLALAPDGRRVVFPASRGGATQLWIRHLTTGEMTPLAGTEGAILPFWSLDGGRVAFFAGGRLKVLTLSSGQIVDLAAAPAPRGGVWCPDGAIVFAPNDDGLVEWRAEAGDLVGLTSVDRANGDSSHRFPALAQQPGEARWDVLYLVESAEPTRAGLWLAGTRLTPSDASGLISADWLLYARSGALFAQRIQWPSNDELHPTLAGQAQLIGMPVGRSPLGQLFATATPEAIVFGAPQPQLRDLRWIDRRDAMRGGTLASEVDAWDLRIAPSGRRVAVTQLDAQLGTLDIWMYEGEQLLPRRISQALDADASVVWSPDASRIAWVQARRSIATRGAEAQLPEQTLRQFDAPIRLWDWSPDGRWFVIGRNRPGTREDLSIVSASDASDASANETPYAASSFNEVQADISPDGRWLAYASDESGQPEIYVDSFPVPGRRARVSTGGGAEPRWGAGLGELFLRRGRELHVATLAWTGETPQATGTARLFDAGGDIRAYDVTADGLRFLLNIPAPDTLPSTTAIVINWQSLLQ